MNGVLNERGKTVYYRFEPVVHQFRELPRGSIYHRHNRADRGVWDLFILVHFGQVVKGMRSVAASVHQAPGIAVVVDNSIVVKSLKE